MNISLAPEVLFRAFGIGFTNTYIVALVILACSFIFAVYFWARGVSLRPQGIQNAVESVFDAWLSAIDGVSGSRLLSLKFFPIVVTIFLFVFFFKHY
jgi:F0F1-type ATP synthase membrane subunit a